MLCDEYFTSGAPFHFSPRHLLRRQTERLAAQGMELMAGGGIGWDLFHAGGGVTDAPVGTPGLRGGPVRPRPVEAGYVLHSATTLDAMQRVLPALVAAFEKIDLPLRSIENEFGPGQVECTFAARPALAAADEALLFRTATRQICRRMGYFATFMCRPA